MTDQKDVISSLVGENGRLWHLVGMLLNNWLASGVDTAYCVHCDGNVPLERKFDGLSPASVWDPVNIVHKPNCLYLKVRRLMDDRDWTFFYRQDEDPAQDDSEGEAT